jgi:site-specific DNA-adenine methylase
MLTRLQKAPFPWFGGKADAADHVWAALGDVEHYVEPFMGSLAVLMRRPHEANRSYHSETVNDLDGLLVNAWRSIQLSPDATAQAASWPVSHADLTARHLAILKWKQDRNLEVLMADPHWHDPVIGGWWIWGISCWIGSGWCSGEGPWLVGADGRITKRKGAKGVSAKVPHLGDDGRGVNRPQAREPGVSAQVPHLGSDGRGVNRPQVREPGVGDYHAMTMPEVRRWFAFLSARLRHVRIINGDWTRAVGSGVLKTINVRQGGACGVFLDPPYGVENRADTYAEESRTLSADVRRWCLEHGGDKSLRIVLAGYDTEHTELEAHGWRVVEWYREGFLKGGYGEQQARERLWLSPHCLVQERSAASQRELFAVMA